jgi:hypothetical protein
MAAHLDNLTDEQCKIASILWACETQEEADEAVERGGIEFAKIRSLLIAAVFDDVEHTKDAQTLIARIKNG